MFGHARDRRESRRQSRKPDDSDCSSFDAFDATSRTSTNTSESDSSNSSMQPKRMRKRKGTIVDESRSESSDSLPVTPITSRTTRGFGLIEDDIYDGIMHCLKNGVKPSLALSSATYQRDKSVYNYIQRKALTIGRAYSPLAKRRVRCLLFTTPSGKKKIALRNSEVGRIIEQFYKLSNGEGARKLFYRISEWHAGVSEDRVQKWLNNNEKHFISAPLFKNKAPLKPVRSTVVHRHSEVDLVDFSTMVGNGWQGQKRHAV